MITKPQEYVQYQSPIEDMEFLYSYVIQKYGTPVSSITVPLQKEYQQIPEVLYGIISYDNDKDANLVDFQVKTNKVTKNLQNYKIEVGLEKGLNSELFGIKVDILAINTILFNNFKITSNQIIEIKKDYFAQKSYLFNSKFQGLNPKIVVFLTGFRCTKQIKQKSQMVSIEVFSQDELGFVVKASSNANSCKLEKVYFNYLEYVNMDSQFLIGFDSQKNQFIENSDNCLNSQVGTCITNERSVELKIDSNLSPTDNKISFMLGISIIEFSLSNNPRIDLKNRQQQQNTSKILIQTRDNTLIPDFVPQMLLIYSKTCKNPQFYVLKDQCTNDCQKYKFGKFGIKQQAFICKVCQNQEILNALCNPCNQNQVYNFTNEKCLSCIQTTQNCCQNNDYSYNSVCYVNQPDRTECDSNKLCKQCIDFQCKQCFTKSEKQQCTSCYSDKYLFDGMCMQKQDIMNAYCDEKSRTCIKCSIENCSSCSTNVDICQSCTQHYYLSENKCISEQNIPIIGKICDQSTRICTDCQQKGICLKCIILTNSNQQCEKCKAGYIIKDGKCEIDTSQNICQIKNCFDCSDNQQCKKCEDNYFLHQGKCIVNSQFPDQYYCYDSITQCEPCKEKNCKKCSNPKLNDYKCEECSNNLYFFNSVCTDKIPSQGVYCDFKKKCGYCSIKNCSKCNSSKEKCDECTEGYNLQNQLCECSLPGYFLNKIDNLCKKCESPCIECKISSTTCTKCGENAIIQNQTCICKDSQSQLDLNNNCSNCTLDLALTKEFGKRICQCTSESFYYNNKNQKCELCRIQNCLRCDADGETCLSCKQGFYLTGKSSQCKYCGYGLFSDQKGICNQNCIEGCILCTNAQTCVRYKDNHVFKGKEWCHFSCQECSGSNQYECYKCSSESRKFNHQTSSCNCKKGYLEIGRADCEKDNSDLELSQIQSASVGVQKAAFLLFLPQFLMNIHPFNDYFLYNFQFLGNLAFVLESTTESFPYYTIFNYLNLQISTSQPSLSKIEVFFLTYTRQIYQAYPIGLLTSGVFSYLALILCLITLIIKKLTFKFEILLKYYNAIYNLQIKIFRVISNYLLVCIFLSLKQVNNQPTFGYILLSSTIIYYISIIIFIFKQTNKLNNSEFNYLSQNLNVDAPYHNKFWLIVEGKKLLSAIIIGYLPKSGILYSMIVINGLSFLFICYIKPFRFYRRDLYYLLSFEVLSLSTLLLELVYLQHENVQTEQQQTLQKLISVTTLLNSLILFIINAEYIIRVYIKKIRQKQHIKNQQSSSPPFLIQMDINSKVSFQDLEFILNQSNWNKSPLTRRKKQQTSICALELTKV